MSIREFRDYPHLSSLSIEQIIRDIGLYSTIQISTRSERVVCEGKTPALSISDDVKKLYDLLRISKPVNLPCIKCKKEYPFVQTHGLDEGAFPQPLDDNTNRARVSAVDSSTTNYSFLSNSLMLNPDIKDESSLISIANTCQRVIL